MALDILIGSILFISALVNILALAAFWATPSLRTTSNRFVINLLLANLIACIILAPTFFLNALNDDVDLENDTTKTKTTTTTIIQNITECGNSSCFTEQEISIISEFEQETVEDEEFVNLLKKTDFNKIRCWGLDVAAAIGSLSVLLVVGDTWCAVTDPLRYHSRISSLKAWGFIAAIWILGIIFGVGSGFRINKDYFFVSNSSIINEIPEELYNTIFSTTYFIVIILIPFGLVCCMYWRIFSEARDNGLRMRQNGSSPLLQSSLNLTHSGVQPSQQQQYTQQQQQTNGGGLTMNIDKQYILNCSKDSCNRPLLFATPTRISNPNQLEIPQLQSDRNQNILLTISENNQNKEIRRNHSARHLFLLDSPPSELASDLRHVHSTPDLHKKLQSSDINSGPVLPLPSIHVPPKALSYMTSIRHRLSNASSLFKYREESRAARISILVVIMFLLSYLPYGILIILQGRLIHLTPSTQALISIFTVLLANLSSPFIFAYRNKRVLRAIKRILGFNHKTNDRFEKHRGTCRTTVAKVKRSVSKASTYSVNSNRYLTPNCANNNFKNTFILEIEKCTDDESSFEESSKSFLKRICDTSRKWDCTSDSCGSGNEQTDV